MPNLVGIGNSQVPTNAMLGGLAYQDSVGEINIDKIKARIDNNATDIFVYDTRNDSDGGAWRHRTQNTSWYNEGVSKSRGARKEFPTVAVIVIESQNLTIYDGDDPNLSMWMDFDYGASGLASITMLYANGKAVSALNGIICCVGEAGWNDGLTAIDFISDTAKWRNSSYIANWANGIGNRNVAGGYGSFITAPNEIIVAAQVNDVAMTVLPNAPINDSTGLPIPTIALATDGGVSVILDSGKVVDSTDGLNWSLVNISEANGGRKVVNYIFSIGGTVRHKFIDNISADWSVDYEDYPHSSASTSVASNGNSDVYGHSSGIMIYKRGNNPGSYNNSNFDDLKAKVTSSFNSGYMPGFIRGAFLSDTDDTNVTGTELVTNGTFGNTNASSVSSWTNVSIGTGTISEGSGVASLNRVNGSNTGRIGQGMNLVAGTRYVLSVDIASGSTSGVQLRQYKSSDQSISGVVRTFSGSTARTISFTFTCESGYDGFMMIPIDNTNTVCKIDNFSVRLAEEDRSGNDKGLAVHGTITKTAVATGADLVAYSGFTTTNHLEQNDNHLFGTGNFCFIFWVKLTAAGNDNQTFIDMSSSNGGVGDPRLRIHQMSSPSGSVRLYTTDGNVVSTSNRINAGWTCVAAVRRSSNLELYINGELEGSGATSTTDFNTYLGQLSIGLDGDGSDPLDNGYISLIRSTSLAPSPQQIKKIFNDEKFLFQENAKCTLYGTSDAVTGLAFDNANGVLHVGTSAGRSEFQGLNRINNTTTAVTTAISASDGLVAEQ